MKILIKDSAEKRQASKERPKAVRDLHGDIAEPPGKYYQYLFH